MQSRLPWMQQFCPFTDRTSELKALDKAFSHRPVIAVIYGRRRIGKTRLIKEWVTRHGLTSKTVFYTARLTSHKHNLQMMTRTAGEQLGIPWLGSVVPENLSSLLRMLADVGVEIVVIDEITYWVRSWPGVASELQYFADHILPETGMMLILSGSIIGVMESAVIGGSAPLYGRARARLRLRPMWIWEARELLGRFGDEDKIRVYSITGGVPYYLCLVRSLERIDNVIEQLILHPHSLLRDEKDLILREEFRDPHSYNAILSAIASGYTTPSKISVVTGLDKGHVSRYLSRLESLDIVARETPLFKKKGYYKIVDPIIRAWYYLVEPVIELLDLELYEEARRRIRSRLESLTSKIWEELAKQCLHRSHARQGYTLAGRLVHKGEELDIALLNPEEKKSIIAEAKWSDLTTREAETLRKAAIRKAHKLLPQDYTVEEAFIAARSIRGETPSWTITPAHIARGECP